MTKIKIEASVDSAVVIDDYGVLYRRVGKDKRGEIYSLKSRKSAEWKRIRKLPQVYHDLEYGVIGKKFWYRAAGKAYCYEEKTEAWIPTELPWSECLTLVFINNKTGNLWHRNTCAPIMDGNKNEGYKLLIKAEGKRKHPSSLITGDVIGIEGKAYKITSVEEIKT